MLVPGEAPARDASPVSVLFGVDRGQVLVSPFAQLPSVAASTSCCCCAAAAAAASRGTVCWLLQLVWVPLVASSKHQNRLHVPVQHAAKGPLEGNSDGQLARLVHRGVGGSPRVMVQHARVMVGATI